MFRPIAIAFAAMSLASAPAVHAAEVQLTANGPVVELDIYETIELEPDTATVSAGVTTDAATAVEALRANSVEMQRVIERIKSLGVDAKDIQTTGINLSPRYEYDGASQRPVFRGYQASNRVAVKLRKIERTGEVLDALVAEGATDIGGPAFSKEDDTDAREAARTRAMERARERALRYAALAGYGDIRLLSISESVIAGGPMPVMEMVGKAADAIAAAPPVQPGMISTAVSISVKYEMVRSGA